jgi:type I restriction enzyme R subunit
MINQNPEQKARDIIDKRLEAAGWVVQDRKNIDWTCSQGIAVREYPTEVGPADYVLFVSPKKGINDFKPVGIIEAKKDEEGLHLTSVEEQTSNYAKSNLKYIDNKTPLRFCYEATSGLTRFTDFNDPKPCSREVFSFHRPETLYAWMQKEKTLRGRFNNLPILQRTGLRQCQFLAISKLEESFKSFKPRALIKMATGAGKTFTAISSVYRLLKFCSAQRILFLVDRSNLGGQAAEEFAAYRPIDDNHSFKELYNVHTLTSHYVPTDSQVYISTIQRLHSILRGYELEDECDSTYSKKTQNCSCDVEYTSQIPPEFFDFIIVDECHRSIYNEWRQVLDYFDAFLIGLTATPDKRTFSFFNKNIVSEYSHEQAVCDGVNVGFSMYTIETEIGKSGAKIPAHEYVETREKLTRKTRYEQIDDDIEYSAKELDRQVVNPSRITAIIQEFKDILPGLFPGRKECPKTLIFAKDDSHADDIVQTIRREFGESNDFCKKIA